MGLSSNESDFVAVFLCFEWKISVGIWGYDIRKTDAQIRYDKSSRGIFGSEKIRMCGKMQDKGNGVPGGVKAEQIVRGVGNQEMAVLLTFLVKIMEISC